MGMNSLVRRIIISGLCLTLFPAPLVLAAGSDDANYGSATINSVSSVYDGDTFRAVINEFPPIIGNRIGIRIAGIDTPEMTDKRPQIQALARKAKQYTVKRLREGKLIKLENMRRDKYFRILADVIIDGTSLGSELIQQGLAKPYEGGTKTAW